MELELEQQMVKAGFTRKDGVWFSPILSEVSYPASGNDACLELEQDSFWFNHRNRIIISLLKRFPPEGAFVEIGGGNGFVAERIQREGINVVMVEPGICGIRNAKQRGVVNLICSAFDDMAWGPGSIPAAGLFDVLEHIEDEVGFLTKLRASLKANGILLVTVPAYQGLYATEDRVSGHFRRYDAKSLSQVLSQAGFGIEYVSYIFGPLLVPYLLLRKLPTMLGLTSKQQGLDLEKEKRNHKKRAGPAAAVLDHLLLRELRRVERLQTVLTGTSCVAVARSH